ncbi:hypothetical protein [Ruania alba]|uniref:Uncharacterized protein n=1 Tax=Ruania alba TaxID=648782 RepID=A0A1H5HB87_9MICO|nr:hypothetical protein [Ruania alba]SEE25125.1 hypothetical protein SAMN04488554_1908 [Ruania alba]
MTDAPIRPTRPHTATQLLLARGGDPFDQARSAVDEARRSVTELLAVLPTQQQGLRETFTRLASGLSLAEQRLSGWQLSEVESRTLAMPTVTSWGEPTMGPDAPVGSTPAAENPDDEPVYGFRTLLGPAVGRLEAAASRLPPAGTYPSGGMHRLMLAGEVAEAARAADHITCVFTAAVWDFERPAMPLNPAGSGRIELRSSARAAPQRRWARRARVLFSSGRVQITTSAGVRVIGEEEPIASLMHVSPPTPRDVLAGYDPAERWAPVPLYDELGVIHFCSESGYSLGAVAVADWLTQPEYQVGQYRATVPAAEQLRARDLLVWGLDTAGFTQGAALLGVPIRRGVMHPPSAGPLQAPSGWRSRAQQAMMPQGGVAPRSLASPGATGFDPEPLIDLLRPAPHLQEYRGGGTRPTVAYKRRAKRRRFWRGDTGPASPANWVLRGPAAWAIVIGGIGSAYLLAETWFIRLCVLWAVAAVIEPWLWWCYELLRDRRARRPAAVYHPGRSSGRTRGFARRTALLYDGSDLGVRGPGGHEAWVAGPHDTERGVVAMRRLMDDGGPWAVALVDRTGRWRAVLPFDHWVPSDDLTSLAGFAETAGLTVGDTYATRVLPTDDVFTDASPTSRARSTGPASRGLLILGFWAAVTTPITLGGWTVATAGLLTLLALAVFPVLARSWWQRRMAQTTR